MVRYGITCKERNGLRGLTSSEQHRLKATPEEARVALDSLLTSNSEGRLAEVFGPQAIGTFRVDPIDCWSNGDPKGVYVDD